MGSQRLSLRIWTVVQKQQRIVIRARGRQDLENLLEATGLKSQIITSTTTDYPHRVLVSPTQWKSVASVLCDSIDYPNFKSEIGLIPGQKGKLSAYHKIWAIMRGVERGETLTPNRQLSLYDDDDHP